MRKIKGTGLIQCLLAPQVVSCEHRWVGDALKYTDYLAMFVPETP